jgi:predicted RNA-binding protein associated with RNAse of E/G family
VHGPVDHIAARRSCSFGSRAEYYTFAMPIDPTARRRHGEVVALRYITTDSRIEMCWPCRVVEDRDDLLALFIAAGSPYKAGPKRSASAKRTAPRHDIPPDDYVWRNDTLRLMFPGRRHSVSLFWSNDAGPRRLLKYFVNMEEPFRRTEVGFDTQDHTLDIELTADFEWRWRDETELTNHVAEGFYTRALAAAVRAEGRSAIESILRREHPCTRDWRDWRPAPEWDVPALVGGWDRAPRTLWELRRWAYADSTPES